ncbi:MAG: aquaporin [Planctomycetota bacterium]
MPEDAEILDDAASKNPPADPIPLRRRLAAESVGTFLLVFFGCGSMAVDAAYGGAVGHVGIGIVWGVVVMALIYAVGDVSGAHFNPAVSFAFWLSGRFRGKDALWYSGLQIVAATLAAYVLLGTFPLLSDLGQTNPSIASYATNLDGDVDRWTDRAGQAAFRAFVFEILLTFALVFVILCVAVGSKERGLMAGIAIGGTVAICALAAGPVCRASMNPARSIGPAVAALDFQYLWLYCIAPIIGAALAVGAWTYIYRHPRPAREVHETTQPGV